jgi:hypothetical protein
MPQAEFFVFVNGERKIHSVAEGGRGAGEKGFRLIEHLVLPPGDYNLRIALRAAQPAPFGAEETVHYRLEKGQNLILKVEPKRFPNRLRVIQIPDKARAGGN